MLDMSRSTNFNNQTSNDEVLTDEMLDGGVFDPSMIEDMPLDGMDAREFATLVAETASAFLPAGANPEEFKRRYVSMTTPLLKFGGFEKITAGMTLGSLVDRNPWIGALICSAATILGLWVCWPRVDSRGLNPGGIEQQKANEVEVGHYA